MLRIQQAMLAIEVGYKSQRIKLAGQTLDEQDFVTLNDLLLKYPSIKSLEFCVCRLKEEKIVELARNLKNTSVVGLQLAHVNMTHEGAAAIATAIQEYPLKKLDLTFNSIGEKGGLRLFHALRDCSLEVLILARNELKSSVLELAKVLATTPTMLVSLDLSKNDIMDEGAVAIANALPNTKIHELFLDLNKLTSVGVNAIVDVIASNKTKVYEISLSGNQIKQSMENINAMLRLAEIEKLCLNLTDLDDTLLLKLGEGIKDCKTIRTLELKDNPKLTNDGVDAFLKFIGAPLALEKIVLEDSGVTAEHIANVVNARLKRISDCRAKSLVAIVSSHLHRIGAKSHIRQLPMEMFRILAEML